MSQTTSNTDLFINNTLQFDNDIINIEQVPIPITISDAKFGILNLKAISAPLSEEDNDFIFMVDCSASMSDHCSDGRDKMHHIIHTLKNMVLYFKENPTIKSHITIYAFDDSIHRILDRSPVNEDNYEYIIAKINKIIPRNMTDIQLAITTVKNTAETIRNYFPNNNIVNIFMTDGEVTCGSKNHSVLSEIVDRNITNAFIGFGIEHDSTLLTTLSNGKNSEYYFIDKLENSGLIYGEILHGIVYKLLKDVTISVQNGLIYDFKNNIWVDMLYVGEIVSEANKNYHIISSNPDECVVILSANKINYPNNSDKNVNITISRIEEYIDNTKYIYRQRTLQHLYIANDFIKRNNLTNNIDEFLFRFYNQEKKLFKHEEITIKRNLRKFIEEIKNYMNENNMEDDKFMKNLCDDIYICYMTFDTKFAGMYTCARLTSQGTQRCYTVSHTPEATQDLYSTNPIKLTRQTNQPTRMFDFDLIQQEDLENNDSFELDDLQHSVSDFRNTPYLTPSSTQVMRDISIGTQKYNYVYENNSIDL